MQTENKPPNRAQLLSEGERQVVALLLSEQDNFSNAEIATQLGIAEKTVEARLSSVGKKIGLPKTSKLAIVKWFLNHNN